MIVRPIDLYKNKINIPEGEWTQVWVMELLYYFDIDASHITVQEAITSLTNLLVETRKLSSGITFGAHSVNERYAFLVNLETLTKCMTMLLDLNNWLNHPGLLNEFKAPAEAVGSDI